MSAPLNKESLPQTRAGKEGETFIRGRLDHARRDKNSWWLYLLLLFFLFICKSLCLMLLFAVAVFPELIAQVTPRDGAEGRSRRRLIQVGYLFLWATAILINFLGRYDRLPQDLVEAYYFWPTMILLLLGPALGQGAFLRAMGIPGWLIRFVAVLGCGLILPMLGGWLDCARNYDTPREDWGMEFTHLSLKLYLVVCLPAALLASLMSLCTNRGKKSPVQSPEEIPGKNLNRVHSLLFILAFVLQPLIIIAISIYYKGNGSDTLALFWLLSGVLLIWLTFLFKSWARSVIVWRICLVMGCAAFPLSLVALWDYLRYSHFSYAPLSYSYPAIFVYLALCVLSAWWILRGQKAGNRHMRC